MSRVEFYGLVCMEKSCLGKEGHLPSRVTCSERLHAKKAELFAEANSARACSDCCLALTELTRLGEPKSLYGEFKLAQLEGGPLPSKKGRTRLGGPPRLTRSLFREEVQTHLLYGRYLLHAMSKLRHV